MHNDRAVSTCEWWIDDTEYDADVETGDYDCELKAKTPTSKTV